jgi:hypothetical protein
MSDGPLMADDGRWRHEQLPVDQLATEAVVLGEVRQVLVGQPGGDRNGHATHLLATRQGRYAVKGTRAPEDPWPVDDVAHEATAPVPGDLSGRRWRRGSPRGCA